MNEVQISATAYSYLQSLVANGMFETVDDAASHLITHHKVTQPKTSAKLALDSTSPSNYLSDIPKRLDGRDFTNLTPQPPTAPDAATELASLVATFDQPTLATRPVETSNAEPAPDWHTLLSES